MTEEKDEKKTKKLTLGGGSKLSLGNRGVYPKGPRPSLGGNSVVVEVKRGKASHNLSLNRAGATATVSEQDERRLNALQKSKAAVLEELNSPTLSRLAEINQEAIEEQEEEENEVLEAVEEVASEKPAPSKHKHEVIRKEKSDSEEEKTTVVKPKVQEQKKLKKSDIITMLDQDLDNVPTKTRSLASIKRARDKERRKTSGVDVKAEKVYREVTLPEVISVGELANRMTERVADVIRELMKLGVMATSSQSIDADTAELIITSFGHSVKRVKESDVENILTEIEDKPEDLQSRAPIVTVMGHVDHGKTSLLDALKETDIVAGESGGITQHIGAYSVTMSDGRMITFIDTPGHEAFTEMRTRGAKVTDIVVLVVAADDGIKAQTIEAISHAKAAEVPIIVAINKIDKPGADVTRVRNELLNHNLVAEELGGDIMTVEVSALKRQNLDKLEEAILLVAEMQELKANPKAVASGVVVETKIDSSKGIITTVIVQRGTLKKSDLIIAGTSYGRIKRICNDHGRSVQEAGPSVAVEIYGLNEAPSAGDIFNVLDSDKKVRDIVDYRLRKIKDSKVTASKTSLEEMFLKASGEGKIKELPLIIKCDVHGSIEAIVSSLNKIESDEVKVKILHSAVGGITESDVTLAKASGAVVLGFNVRANPAAARSADDGKVDIRYYSIIYNLIDDIRAIMSGMLSPILREVYLGSVDIREVFNITKVGKIAGCYVTKGIVKRGAGVRLVREDIIIHEGKLKTLKRFKDDVKEVREGFECGIAFENYNDIKVGDSVEVFEIVEEQKTL